VPAGPDPAALADELKGGGRRALAQAITLVEGTRPDQIELARELLERVLPATGNAIRLGISGTPGVGKSTLIEALGLRLCDRGLRVAVLAVDPSSPVSGGSVLGDKTRMEALGRRPEAFIRPSPSRGTMGGVTNGTREALLLCEAAGFDVVIVETVGVGQSEVDVASMVDTFMLLLQPAAGDALQGIKRGILELADLLVVTKADGELTEAARRTQKEYAQGVALTRPAMEGWTTPVLTSSALTGVGLDELWAQVEAHRAALARTGDLRVRRAAQAERWLRAALMEGIEGRLRADPRLAQALRTATEAVRSGAQSPTRAAAELTDALLGSAKKPAG
jgi:LAO/AO transport system kinase